jgi:hypothetical protein
MKYLYFLLIFFFAVFGSNKVQSQNIIDDLQSTPTLSEGYIHIESDAAITALIGVPGNRVSTDNTDAVERSGYRIQVFMGNHSGARSEANSKQASIHNAFPDLATYVNYEAPNWKLLAGDFLTREEATVVKQQLQREFPNFGKEMYIIVSKIKIPVDRDDE